LTQDTLPTQYAALSLPEVCWLCGMSRWSVVGAIERKDLRAHRTTPTREGHWRVARDDLVLWMNSCGVPLDLSLRGRGRFGSPPGDFARMKLELRS
jgi:hypothetical protein